MSSASEPTKDTWFFNDKNSTGVKRPAGDSNPDISRMKDRADVVIGEKSFISGALQLDGMCLIEGTIEGEVSSTGELVISETGVVKARISGSVVRVLGRVVGDIECTTRLELKTGAVVTGNISATGLVIEDGVVYQGYCTMVQRTPLSGLNVEIERTANKNTSTSTDGVLELTRSVSSDTSESAGIVAD